MKKQNCIICGNPKAYKAKRCDSCYAKEFEQNKRNISKNFKNAEL